MAGGRGSGKSTVSQQVLASFGADMVSVIMQNDYYRDQSDLAPEVRRKQNYDDPQAFDWPLLVRHVRALRNGEAIGMPVYDFTIDNRTDDTILVDQILNSSSDRPLASASAIQRGWRPRPVHVWPLSSGLR